MSSNISHFIVLYIPSGPSWRVLPREAVPSQAPSATPKWRLYILYVTPFLAPVPENRNRSLRIVPFVLTRTLSERLVAKPSDIPGRGGLLFHLPLPVTHCLVFFSLPPHFMQIPSSGKVESLRRSGSLLGVASTTYPGGKSPGTMRRTSACPERPI